jgi:hypothetical protein
MSRARLVKKAIQALLNEAPTPLADGLSGGSQLLRYSQVELTLCALEHDLCSVCELLRNCPPSNEALESGPLLFG